MAKRTFDLIAWAKTQPKVRSGRICSVCKDPAIADAVARLVRAVDAGEVSVTVKQMHPMLVEHYGLDVSQSTLWTHVREHVRGKAARRGA